MSDTGEVLLHAVCPCGQVVRSVRAGTPCSCGRCEWRAKNTRAFAEVFEGMGGWYGVEYWKAVVAGDAVEILAGDGWLPAIAAEVDAQGFSVELAGNRKHYSLADKGTRWRWPDSPDSGPDAEAARVGPFPSREAAQSVRYDAAPGYLVCGVCGEEDWRTKLPGHYRAHHPGSLEVLVDDDPQVIGQRLR